MNRIAPMQARSGVALIVVLGLISVFMLSAVSFSISMRQERQGSARLRDGVQVRHVLWVGLSSAIDQINKSMDSGGAVIDMYPDWDLESSPSNNVGFSPPTAILNSRFLETTIPASANQYIGDTNMPSYWAGVTNSSGAVKGRFAYVIVNASEYLDVSMMGTTNRRYGKSTAEVDFSAVSDIVSSNDFVKDMKRHVRYETLAEMASLNTGVADSPSNIVTWSMAPVNESIDANYYPKPKVLIGGTSWTNKPDMAAKIKQAFYDSGLRDNPAPAGIYYGPSYAYSNLLDYVDADSIPRMEPMGPNGEAVPMIYALMVMIDVRVNAAGLARVRTMPYIKWLYPFVNKQSEKFTMDYSLEFSPGVDNTYSNLIPTNLSAVADTGWCPALDNHVVRDYALPVGIVTRALVTNPFIINFDVLAKARIKLSDGSVVDAVPGAYGFTNNVATNTLLKLNFTVSVANPVNFAYGTNNWIECVDPRFNWDPINPYQWMSAQFLRAQLGSSYPYYSQNDLACSTLALMTNFSKSSVWYLGAHFDGDTRCYVANKPLENVGELGNIVIRPWSTIRLYDHGCGKALHGADSIYHKVLDYFYVSPTNTTYKRGVININTLNSNVLAAAFSRCPSAEWTNNTDYCRTISPTNALKLGDAIVKGGPYRTLAQIGAVNAYVNWNNNWFDEAVIPSTNTYEFMREGAIRNTADMLTTRYNNFYIIVKAEAYSEGMGGDKTKGASLANAYAIAEVWRDPFRMYLSDGITPALDGNGKPVHRTLIRSFRIIDE